MDDMIKINSDELIGLTRADTGTFTTTGTIGLIRSDVPYIDACSTVNEIDRLNGRLNVLEEKINRLNKFFKIIDDMEELDKEFND